MSEFAWSYSRLNSFETCGFRHLHYNILRDVSDASDSSNEGQQAHLAYKERIDNAKPLPLPLSYQEPTLNKLTSLPGIKYTEMKLALDRDFRPTGYFADNVWFRTILDLCIVAPSGRSVGIVDFKTGKPSNDMTQLELASATVMHYMPEVERVQARLLFMAHNRAERANYTRDDLTRIWGNILPRVRRMEQAHIDEDFPPKPSGLCVRWCAVTSCAFHGRGTGAPRTAA